MRVRIIHTDDPDHLFQVLQRKFSTPLVHFQKLSDDVDTGSHQIEVEIDEEGPSLRWLQNRADLIEEIVEMSEEIIGQEVIEH